MPPTSNPINLKWQDKYFLAELFGCFKKKLYLCSRRGDSLVDRKINHKFGVKFSIRTTGCVNINSSSPPLFYMNNTFITYLTNERIAEQLCKEYGKYLRKPSQELQYLLPDSQYWKGYSKKEDFTRATAQQLKKRLSTIVQRHIATGKQYPYLQRLYAFADELRHIAQDKDFHFPKPTIKAIIKDKSTDPIICRPVCKYDDLKIKLLISLMAQYLKATIDSTFHHNSLAYRAPRDFMGEKKVTTNKDAIRLLLQYRQLHDNETIFAAECDICKFFDTINHDDVKHVLIYTFDRLNHKDDQFITLFNAFVDSFSFQDDIYKLNNDPHFWQSAFPGAPGLAYCFKWVDNSYDHPVGLPQGAAICPIIANMLLNWIDGDFLKEKLVNGKIHDPNLFFVRFCDDILLMHTNNDECQDLFTAYCTALTKFHLTYHEPRDVSMFKSENRLKPQKTTKRHHSKVYDYWDNAKTKKTFLWGSGKGNSAEWIGFLGYEIKRDGQVRIRKSSIGVQARHIIQAIEQIRHADAIYQKELLEKFLSKKIGGSNLDQLDVTNTVVYDKQRNKLQKLKDRQLYRIQS